MSRWFVLLCVGGLLALLALGCEEHLAGTHDVALVYRIGAVDPNAPAADLDEAQAKLVARNVKSRLSAAHIAADVHPFDASDAHDVAQLNDSISPQDRDTKRLLVLVVDEDEAPSVKTLLAWRGGITLMALDKAAGDPLYEGTPEQAADRLQTAKVDADHLVVLDLTDEKTARLRVVKSVPALAIESGIADIDALRGNVIDLTLDAATKPKVAPLIPELQSGALIVVRGRSVLPFDRDPGDAPSTGDHLYIGYPRTLPGYAHAKATRFVLETPLLPPLTRANAARAPVDRLLAAGCLVVPFVLSALWLLFVRRFDRAEPEPMWLVGATFLLGCVSCVPAGLAELAFAMSSPWLNPSYITMGGQLFAVPLSILVFTLVVGVSEEGSKFLGAWSLARHRKEFDQPVDGIIYGAASALGFAAVENVKYFALGRLSAALIVARMFMSIPAHLLFASLWGYGMGKRLAIRRARVWPWFLLAALLHGAFDTFLSFGVLSPLSFLLEGGMALAFIALLRRALRYGPALPASSAKDANANDEEARVIFTVGSVGRFVLSSVGFVFSMLPLAGLATFLEAIHPHAANAWPWILTGSVLVFFSGLMAYAVSATMPLDVVLDGTGVTFAGSRRAWSTVRGISTIRTKRGYLRLASSAGDLYIGPMDPLTMARVEHTVISHAAGQM